MKLEIKQQDIIPYVYFVSSMAQQSKSGMFGSLSSKSDLVGGIFDRWINIIPESVSFNRYFIPKAKKLMNTNKSVEVISDFFMYKPNKVGIAPDVFGIKVDNKTLPFVKYDDTRSKKDYWEPQANCPQVEVKSFFGSKFMVSLRNQHYENKFLVMIEANINSDYLLSYFDKTLFNKTIEEKLLMPDIFIINNTKKLISQTKKVIFDKDNLGTISILKTTTAKDFMDKALKLLKGEVPKYFKEVKERKQIIQPDKYEIEKYMIDYCDYQNNTKLYRFKKEWQELFKKSSKATNEKIEKTLDCNISNPHKIKIIGSTQNSIIVMPDEDSLFNGKILKAKKQYNIYFSTFGAVSNEEYFMLKSEISCLENKEKDLVNMLSQIIKKN